MTKYRGYELDDQLVPVLEGLAALQGAASPVGERSVGQARRMLVERARYYQNLGARRTKELWVEDQQIPGPGGRIPLRMYRPLQARDKKLPALLYLHGGAWMRGSLDTHDDLAGRLADELMCVVVSVDYRLAPEHPFPAALEDASCVLQWAFLNAAVLGINIDRVGLAGDSSGGNLAATLALKNRDEDGLPLTCQILLNPVLDLSSFNTRSYLEYGDKGFGLTREKMIWARQLYAPDEGLWHHPYVSPLCASDLSRLPPAIIVTSEYDPLRDEGERYARRLAKSGIAAEYYCIPKMIHGAFDLLGVLDCAGRAMARLLNEYRRFGRGER